MDIRIISGILTPLETLAPPPPATSVSSASLTTKKFDDNVYHINWQTILRDATFHSLIKHTQLTPSLDEKIETDRLLWEKIQSAKFLRKQGRINDFDKVKTGVLVDTTRERGYLEFRQSDRSVYNCEQSRCKPIYDRLLAVWRVQKLEPSTIWIKVKIPRYPLSEDVYEFTPKQGLKQINFEATEKDSKDGKYVWKSTTNIDGTSVEKHKTNVELPVSRLDAGYYHHSTDLIKNTYKKPVESYRQSPYPPTYFPYIVGLQLDSEVKDTAWPQTASYYHVNPYTVLSEFTKHDQTYDGFLPSLGPTGRPSTLAKPLVFNHYSTYLPTRIDNNGLYFTSTTPKNFKPSTEFIRYSEPDPFYLDNRYAYTTPRTNDIDSKVTPNSAGDYNRLQTSINSQLLNHDRNKKFNKETNLLISATTTKPGFAETSKGVQSTESLINTLNLNENIRKSSLSTTGFTQITTQLSTKPTTAITLMTTTTKPTIQSTTNKPRTISQKLATPSYVSQSYGYAPLFIKWGDKIMNSSDISATNRNYARKSGNSNRKTELSVSKEAIKKLLENKASRIKSKIMRFNQEEATEPIAEDTNLEYQDATTTVTSILNNITTTDSTNNYNTQTENYESDGDTTTEDYYYTEDTTETEFTSGFTEPFSETTVINTEEWQDQVTDSVDSNKLTKNDATTFIIDTGSTNLVIDFEDKSPEEVVNELTTIGVKNSTRVEGYPETSEQEFNSYNTLKENNNPIRTTSTLNDQEIQYTDPVSIVVNRISKSFSYKTANSQARNLKKVSKNR